MKITFKKVLWIYAGIWLIVTIGICAYLWNVFADYQNRYEVAEDKANPDHVVEAALDEYSVENISSLVDESIFENVSEYESDEVKRSYITDLVEGKTITYARNENFKSRKPNYDILADGKKIGNVVLTQLADSDEFGFHMCELGESTLDVTPPQSYISITANIGGEDVLVINGNTVSDELATYDVVTKIEEQAVALTDHSLQCKSYTLEGFLANPTVECTSDNQTEILTLNNEGVYGKDTQDTPELDEELSVRIIDACEAYALNMNLWGSFADVATYLEPGSAAYDAVESVQSGLKWAGKADKLEIVSSDITDAKIYSDDCVVVTTSCKLTREYRDETYNDEMNYQWLYVKANDKWLIRDFTIAK